MANSWFNGEGLVAPKIRYRVIKNSATIKKGDMITDDSVGVSAINATNDKILGLCIGIFTPEKTNFASASIYAGAYTGTWTASTQSYAAAADNQTVDTILAGYIPAREDSQFIMLMDDTLGVTTGSNKEGYYVASLVSDASKLDESTTSTSSASTQWRILYVGVPGLQTNEVVVQPILRIGVQSAAA